MTRRAQITGLVLAVLWSEAAFGQVTEQDLQRAKKGYDDCVMDSVYAQLMAGAPKDTGALGEQGFVACATEERVLRANMSLSGMRPEMAEFAVLGIKKQIKETLRDMRTNPGKFRK